jgi:hypothetical protein
MMDVCIIIHNMVVESHRENYSVSDYMNTGQRWYAATNVFHQMTGTNNLATTNINSMATNDNSPTAMATTTTTTTATNNRRLCPCFKLKRKVMVAIFFSKLTWHHVLLFMLCT